MEHLDLLLNRVKNLSDKVNQKKESDVHVSNIFNKQLSKLLVEGCYLSVILERIKADNPDTESTQLNLDIKSLYIFSKIFTESVIYLTSLFVKSTPDIKWEKLGPFIAYSEKHLDDQPETFVLFWKECGQSIKALQSTLGYRNNIAHSKKSDVEWTMHWSGLDNLEMSKIVNFPWEDDAIGGKMETLAPNDLMMGISKNITVIINYLENNF